MQQIQFARISITTAASCDGGYQASLRIGAMLRDGVVADAAFMSYPWALLSSDSGRREDIVEMLKQFFERPGTQHWLFIHAHGREDGMVAQQELCMVDVADTWAAVCIHCMLPRLLYVVVDACYAGRWCEDLALWCQNQSAYSLPRTAHIAVQASCSSRCTTVGHKDAVTPGVFELVWLGLCAQVRAAQQGDIATVNTVVAAAACGGRGFCAHASWDKDSAFSAVVMPPAGHHCSGILLFNEAPLFAMAARCECLPPGVQLHSDAVAFVQAALKGVAAPSDPAWPSMEHGLYSAGFSLKQLSQHSSSSIAERALLEALLSVPADAPAILFTVWSLQKLFLVPGAVHNTVLSWQPCPLLSVLLHLQRVLGHTLPQHAHGAAAALEAIVEVGSASPQVREHGKFLTKLCLEAAGHAAVEVRQCALRSLSLCVHMRLPSREHTGVCMARLLSSTQDSNPKVQEVTWHALHMLAQQKHWAQLLLQENILDAAHWAMATAEECPQIYAPPACYAADVLLSLARMEAGALQLRRHPRLTFVLQCIHKNIHTRHEISDTLEGTTKQQLLDRIVTRLLCRLNSAGNSSASHSNS